MGRRDQCVRLATGALASALCMGAGFATRPAGAEDHKPVVCPTTRAYEGPPVYAGEVELPDPEFTLGPRFVGAVSDRLNEALQEARRRTGAVAITAAVATRNGRWASEADGAEPSPALFYWASVGKAFTAAVIMQMVEEGRLKLSDPIARWQPNVPNASVITVDHVLQHTAGLFSANEDLQFRNRPRYLSPEESIALSARHGAMFCPGQFWRYSNTGYTVLGTVISQIDGVPFHESVNRRLAGRLGLKNLRALAPGEEPPDLVPFRAPDRKAPLMLANWGYAAGNVIGAAEDMLRFWHALLTAKLLSRQTTRELFARLHPMFDDGTFYGRGVMAYVLPEGRATPRVWLGHGGGTPGMQALVAWSATDRAFVAVSLTGEGSAPAVANLLLKQLAPADGRSGDTR